MESEWQQQQLHQGVNWVFILQKRYMEMLSIGYAGSASDVSNDSSRTKFKEINESNSYASSTQKSMRKTERNIFNSK